MDLVTGLGRDLTKGIGKATGRDIEGLSKDLGEDLKGIGEYIRQQRSSARISLRQLSKLAGVSNPYLSQIERGLRKPSAEILQQIAKGLRISAEALYVQAGILDAPAGGPVPDAILAAVELTERQKQVLLDVYETFRRANAAETDQENHQSTVEGSDVDNVTSKGRTPNTEE
ncbi:MAG TPA: helix-turn-helix transcriptional regulator [Pseudonocardiaceae bacterium]|jgi:transcriptional regulator with XRE-family HTH domain